MTKRVEDLLDQLTLEEQVSLLAGRNMWETVPIERLAIPRMRVSDGPAGVRGSKFDGPASMNVPCGTAIAASWNRSLVRQLGELLGREMHAKGARVHLAPTVNLHRTPVGGRNFECMSEDPYLTAETAVEYVRGVQSQGVASCIKHFVGNDTEFERMTIDSQIDERTLREVYLVPFERAVRDAEVMSVMTSYNRINGDFGADSTPMLQGVLRDEWGFDGCVISDWFGVHSTAASVNAGCDLEMPGPTLHRGQQLIDAVERGEVSREMVRERARNVLNLMERTGALDNPPGPEITRDDPSDIAILHSASAAGMVLLKNEENVLPLATGNLRTVAVLGPNAGTSMVMGGGSAHVTATRVSHVLDAIRDRIGGAGVDIVHGAGCNINRKLPELDMRLLSGVTLEYFAAVDDLDTGAAPAQTGTTGVFRMMWFRDPLGRKGNNFGFGARFSMQFTPDVTGEWQFGVESVAPVKLMIDGRVVLDNTDAPVGGSFFGNGKYESTVGVELEAGRAYSFVAEVRHSPTGMGLGGINLGAQAPVDDDMLNKAVDMAARADLSIVVVGTNDDWESEGWDREDIDLPGDQNVLVEEVAKVSKRTVVVVNAGSPVAMPWINDVQGVIYTWFAGQEMGDALVDILTGEVEPSGRLPVTLPKKIVDTPAAEHHPGRNGKAQYLEGRLIGYRWYDKVGRDPLFPFGFGLGYAEVAVTGAKAIDSHTVEATLTNTSSRDGVQVVQVYAHRVDRDGLPNDEPVNILAGYERVEVPAGGSATVRVRLNSDTYRTWDIVNGCWSTWSGPVELRVGTSSRDVTHVLSLLL
jgi:beta-glucosidase